jgi:hypothetical protein
MARFKYVWLFLPLGNKMHYGLIDKMLLRRTSQAERINLPGGTAGWRIPLKEATRILAKEDYDGNWSADYKLSNGDITYSFYTSEYWDDHATNPAGNVEWQPIKPRVRRRRRA